MTRVVAAGFVLLSFANAYGEGFTDAVRRHLYEFTYDDGALKGAGADFLEEATARAQFVALAEPHNLDKIPVFSAALFAMLQGEHGFEYKAAETGPYIMERASAAVKEGGREAFDELFMRYLDSFHFSTDEELDLLYGIAERSKAKSAPLWGVDQVHSATPLLDRLIEIAPNEALREQVKEVAFAANMHNRARAFNERAYLLQDVDVFDELEKAFAESGPEEARFLSSQLAISHRVYRNIIAANEDDAATGYLSNVEREQNMKHLFMRYYRAAVAAGDGLPKVLLKLGHWHVLAGRSPGNAYTLGNFVKEFATSNGMDSYSITLSIMNEPGSLWSLSDDEAFRPLTDATSHEKNVVVDLRALRPLLHAGQLEGYTAAVRDWVYQYDAVVLLGGVSRGSRTLERDAKRAAREAR